MQSLPTQKRVPPDQRKLLDLYVSLEQQNKQSLLAFAEFLANREQQVDASIPEENKPLEPKIIPRPATESVVKAIKRLSATYYMLEREKMLDETASLMTSHVMHGRKAVSVIDDLESLFKQHYQRYLDMY